MGIKRNRVNPNNNGIRCDTNTKIRLKNVSRCFYRINSWSQAQWITECGVSGNPGKVCGQPIKIAVEYDALRIQANEDGIRIIDFCNGQIEIYTVLGTTRVRSNSGIIPTW